MSLLTFLKLTMIFNFGFILCIYVGYNSTYNVKYFIDLVHSSPGIGKQRTLCARRRPIPVSVNHGFIASLL